MKNNGVLSPDSSENPLCAFVLHTKIVANSRTLIAMKTGVLAAKNYKLALYIRNSL